MFLTVPAAIGLAMLRDPATIVLLEHAEFTRIDSVFTASALGWYCLGIVPQAGIEIHSRGFYALGDTRTPVALAVAAVVVNLVLSGLLWGRYGHEGLAFSVSAASWLEWAVLYRLYAQRTGASVAADLRAMATVAVCGAGMALFLAVGLAPMEQGSWDENLVVAVAGAAAGAAVYAGLANLLHVEEIGEAVRRVNARFSRPAA
jgi:putative peptidoglycan lipid II flippase